MPEDLNLPGIRFVSQDDLFVGLRGFGLMSDKAYEGVDRRDRREYLFAIPRDEITAEGVAASARHMLNTGIEGIVEDIARGMIEQTPLEVIGRAELNNARPFMPGEHFCTSVESVAAYANCSPETACQRIINSYVHNSTETFESLRAKHAGSIVNAASEQVATIAALAGLDRTEVRERMAEVLAETWKAVPKNHHDNRPFIHDDELIKPLQAALKETITRVVEAIEQNPQAFAEKAAQAVQDITAIKPPAPLPPEPKRSLLQKLTDAAGITTPPEIDRYRTPQFVPSPALPEAEDVKRVVAETLGQMPDDMRRLIHHAGATVVIQQQSWGSSHSLAATGEVQLLLTAERNGLPQALDPKVVQEEFTHHVCGHPSLTFHTPEVSSAWRDAFNKDLGGTRDKPTPEQQEARDLLTEHTSCHTPSWKRTYYAGGPQRHNQGYQDEVFYEILEAQQSGTDPALLAEKLPNLMKLYTEARSEMQAKATELNLPEPPPAPERSREWEQRVEHSRATGKRTGHGGPG